jgi:hypothetical protein
MPCKIYKITSNNTNKIYIGSTTQDLQTRLKAHIRDYTKYRKFWIDNNDSGLYYCCSSRKILMHGDVNIELIDEVANKRNRMIVEQFYINLYNDVCVNEGNAFSDYRYKYKNGIIMKIVKHNALDNRYCNNCNNKGHDTTWINCCKIFNNYKHNNREIILNDIRNVKFNR